MRKNQKRKGFTLVEMLIVIAIVAILISIIIPTVGYSTRKAAAATNAANLRSIQAMVAEEKLLRSGDFANYLETGKQLQELAQTADKIFSFLVPGANLGLGNMVEGNYMTVKAVGGTLTFPLSPDVTYTNVPVSEGLTIIDKDGNSYELREGLQVEVYITENNVLATYGGYTVEEFADIAVDGILDGSTAADKENDVDEGFAGQIYCGIGSHKDETGDCICDRSGCGAEWHPGRDGAGGDGRFCTNNNPNCPYQKPTAENCTHEDVNPDSWLESEDGTCWICNTHFAYVNNGNGSCVGCGKHIEHKVNATTGKCDTCNTQVQAAGVNSSSGNCQGCGKHVQHSSGTSCIGKQNVCQTCQKSKDGIEGLESCTCPEPTPDAGLVEHGTP